MKVLLLSQGFDTAGQGAAIRSALVHHRPDWQVDQVRRKDRWGYPSQHPYDQGLILRLWRRASVVHLTESPSAFWTFGRGAKPLVIHHHGDAYRKKRAELDRQCRALGAVQVVSTLDLLGLPDVEWLPVVADLDALAAMRWPRDDDLVHIATSPTDRSLKGTDMLEASVARLAARGLPVALDVIEKVPWAECLARKARAAIFVDQFPLGYGLSAVEAWGMGLPVVAGMTDPVTRERMMENFGSLPFIDARPDTLDEILIDLVTDRTLREHWGSSGRRHAERFHSESAVAERLDGIYAQAIAVAA
jgi:glycosyltransferase involved in cell wall biosynthesis